MKKLIVLAVTAIFAANISAQEVKAEIAECKQPKKERKLSLQERTERDIKILAEELYLSEEQEKGFAATYREYIAAQEKLRKEFATKFAKDLNQRQVQAVMRFHGPKHAQFQDRPAKGPQCGDLKCKPKHQHKSKQQTEQQTEQSAQQ